MYLNYSASDELQSLVKNVSFETDWVPSQEILMAVFFSAASDSVFNSRYYRSEETSSFKKILCPEIFPWFWNQSSDKIAVFTRLLELYNHQNYNSGYRNGIGEQNKQAIKNIVDAVWDVLPEDSTSTAIQSFRVAIARAFSDKVINWTDKLLEASLSSDKPLFDLWKKNGMEVSSDPAFYSFLWSKVERGRGYTDAKNEIIHSSSRCRFLPEAIINDLTSSGHNKNRSSVIRVLTHKIDEARQNIERNKDSPAVSIWNENIAYCQATMAKFSSCEDYDVLRAMIPYLKREDLVFVAPAAAKVGLQQTLDRYMNPDSYQENYRRYRY
jgi:hypothetical protein